MNPYLEPHGFLGTGASLLADVTVLAYLLLIIPAMLVGFIFARRKLHRPHHKWTMTTIMIVNWVLIIFLMFAAYRFDVAPNIASQPNNTRYLLPAVHALFGLPAQLLATFIVVRMFLEDAQVSRAKMRGEKDTSRYWFRRAKPVMRLTLALWLVTALLGVVSYLTRYNVVPAFALSAKVIAPAATPEVLAPVSTEEVLPPVTTPEVVPPLATEEIASPTVTPTRTALPPAETEELASDTPTRRPTATVSEARTPRPPAATEDVLAPLQTEELASDTPTRRPSATRRPATATRTPHPPAATEEPSS